MPQFYFHIRDGDDLAEDCEGSDLPDLEAAQKEAAEAAREIMSNSVLAGTAPNGRQFEITNADGDILGVVPFKSILSAS